MGMRRARGHARRSTLAYPTYAYAAYGRVPRASNQIPPDGGHARRRQANSWKYYAPADRYVSEAILVGVLRDSRVRYGKDWNNHVSSPKRRFVTDASYRESAGRIVGDSRCGSDSDHGGSTSEPGALRGLPRSSTVGEIKAWDSTAIFVLRDDWGGWYDDAGAADDLRPLGPGRYACRASSIRRTRSRTTFRTRQYEFGSILKFVENTFDACATLGITDAKVRRHGRQSSISRNCATLRYVHVKAPLLASIS